MYMKRFLLSMAVLTLVLGFGASSAYADPIRLTLAEIQSIFFGGGSAGTTLAGCVDIASGTQCTASWTVAGVNTALFSTSALAIGYAAGNTFVIPIENSNASPWTWTVTVITFGAGTASASATFAPGVTHTFSIALPGGPDTITLVSILVSGDTTLLADSSTNFIVQVPEPGTLALLGTGLLGLVGLLRRRS